MLIADRCSQLVGAKKKEKTNHSTMLTVMRGKLYLQPKLQYDHMQHKSYNKIINILGDDNNKNNIKMIMRQNTI